MIVRVAVWVLKRVQDDNEEHRAFLAREAHEAKAELQREENAPQIHFGAHSEEPSPGYLNGATASGF